MARKKNKGGNTGGLKSPNIKSLLKTIYGKQKAGLKGAYKGYNEGAAEGAKSGKTNVGKGLRASYGGLKGAFEGYNKAFREHK